MFDFLPGLIVLAILLLLNGLLSAARSALVNASKAQLRQMAEQGVAGATLAAQVAEDATPLIATIRLGQTVCRFFAAGLAAVLFAPALAESIRQIPLLAPYAAIEAFVCIILLAALFVVGVVELLPEAWVLRAPEQAALVFAPFVAALEWLLGPIVRAMLWMAEKVATPLAGRRLQFVTEEEIKMLVDAGEEGGVLEEDEKEMIYSIFDIRDTLAREIMVPRTDVLALEVDTPLDEAMKTVIEATHSRIPVYQDTIDNVLGLLYVKDLLRVRQDAPPGLRGLLRPAHFIPETKKVDELLTELQQKRIHLAIVVDEYGGMAGLVTLEDIVEEIVGDIRDEYDANEEAQAERINEHEYIFDARIDIDEVNELLNLKLPSEDSDSLGGYIYGQLGHVPASGEKVHTPAGDAHFEVLTVTGRRIRKVRAVRVPPPPPPEPSPRPKITGPLRLPPQETPTHDG